jgi:prepilin-type N-terminal cleavage/methylation domain-containing protein
MTTDRPKCDRGFTLVEVVICVALLGIIAPVLLAMIVVTLKSSPAVADRADSATIVQGLVTWLPQDIDSAAPGSFDASQSAPSGCSGTDPGFNLLKLSWTETISSTKTYTASYRYVPKSVPADGGRVVRVYCALGAAPQTLNVTGVLPAWVAGSEPVKVTLSDAPDGDSLALFDTAQIDVTPVVGKLISIIGTTKNPNETLPTTPPTTTPTTTSTTQPNQPPVADNVAVTITSATPVSISVSGSDPEGGALTATFPSIPAGWAITPSGALTFTVTAPVAADNTVVVIPYKISDPLGSTANGNVTFTVQPASAVNQPPVANPSSGSTTAGSPVVVTLAASDPEGAVLTASVTGVPAGWTSTVSGLQVTVTPSAGAIAGNFVLNYSVTDPGGLSASSTLTITVTGPPPCVINTPVLDRYTVQLKKNDPDALRNEVTMTITIVSGYCVGLALHYDTGAPNGQYVRSFSDAGTTRSITLPNHPSPELWSTGTKALQVKDSSSLVIGSVNLEVTL